MEKSGVGKSKRKEEKKLVLFDRLKRQKVEDNFTIWQGSKGTYLFRAVEASGEPQKRRPLREVYLNRQYLTGLFKAEIGYSGDIKEPDRKRYLIFKPLSKFDMDIYERVN